MMLAAYILTVLVLVAGGTVFLAGANKAPASQRSKNCPVCGARLFFRQMQRHTGTWTCGACGCDRDEFGNTL